MCVCVCVRACWFVPLQSIGLGEQAFDVAFSITSAEGKFIYPLAEDWDEDAIREHIDAFLAGTLEPWMK